VQSQMDQQTRGRGRFMKGDRLFTCDVRPGHLFRIPDCPDNVMLDLTWRCNYRCSFCYNPSAVRTRADPPFEVTAAILRGLAAWGVREVLYLGGEPMLHARFNAVIELGAALRLSQRVVTNGSVIDEARARVLALHGVEVGVSLHSADRNVHDRLTGEPQGWEKATAGLSRLIDHGVRCFVQYSPSRLERRGLVKLSRFLRSRYGDGVRCIDVNRLLPFGEAADDRAEVVLRAEGWWDVMKMAGEVVSSGWTIRVESVPHCWVRERARNDGLAAESVRAILSCIRACYMGLDQLALTPSGVIKLCPGSPATECSMIESAPSQLWREHPALVARRSYSFLPRECVNFGAATTCVDFYDCLGGCRFASGRPSPESDPLAITASRDSSDRVEMGDAGSRGSM
jgi:molybdenum cofactor biosynthesis enzyme MoaA